MKNNLKTVYPKNPIDNYIDWITWIKLQNRMREHFKRVTGNKL